MKHGTQKYLVYIIVLKCFELKTTTICLKLQAKLRFYGFLSVLGIFSHKTVQTRLFRMKVGTQQYLVYIILLKWLELKMIVTCLQLRAKLCF